MMKQKTVSAKRPAESADKSDEDISELRICELKPVCISQSSQLSSKNYWKAGLLSVGEA